MDPDLLRLLLLVLGVLLVAGIYLWDRYKHTLPRVRTRRMPPRRDLFEAGPADPADGADAGMGQRDYRSDGHAAGDGGGLHDDPLAARARRGGASEFDPEPGDLGDWSTDPRASEPTLPLELRFDAHGGGDYLRNDPALADDVEHKLIVIHLAARAGAMIGPGIEKACAAAHLAPGDMGIFHRRDAASGRVLFSLASMVEPGSFPFDDMTDFRTPGLSMFTQLPGARDGVEIYTEMLTAARELARLLNAEIQDERHNKLTQQMQDHMRDSIIEHRTRVRLARSRV